MKLTLFPGVMKSGTTERNSEPWIRPAGSTTSPRSGLQLADFRVPGLNQFKLICSCSKRTTSKNSENFMLENDL